MSPLTRFGRRIAAIRVTRLAAVLDAGHPKALWFIFIFSEPYQRIIKDTEMSDTNRRNFLGYNAAAAAAAVALPASPDESAPTLAFSDRAHIFARPHVKEKLTWCFSTVLGCGAPATLNAPGLSEPILAFRFPSGGSLSVEFTEDALDEQNARRGAWLEIRSNDPAALKKNILEAGLSQVHYPATNTFYFIVPGGQVLGIVSAR